MATITMAGHAIEVLHSSVKIPLMVGAAQSYETTRSTHYYCINSESLIQFKESFEGDECCQLCQLVRLREYMY